MLCENSEESTCENYFLNYRRSPPPLPNGQARLSLGAVTCHLVNRHLPGFLAVHTHALKTIGDRAMLVTRSVLASIVLLIGISNSPSPLQAAEASANVLDGVHWVGPAVTLEGLARQDRRGDRLCHLVPDLQQVVGRFLQANQGEPSPTNRSSCWPSTTTRRPAMSSRTWKPAISSRRTSFTATIRALPSETACPTSGGI